MAINLISGDDYLEKKTKISLDGLAEGILEQDVFNLEGQLLLSKGSYLKPDSIMALRRRGITHVLIAGEANDLPVSAAAPKAPQAQIVEVYDKALDFVKNFMAETKQERKIDVGAVYDTVKQFSRSYFSDSDLLGQLRRIKNKDEYLYTHSINVAILSTMIGRWLEYDQGTIEKLGVAGLLHDIGKVYIPEDILNKPARLTDREYEVIKNHSVLGYKICQNSANLEPGIMAAVLMHHERMDGSGYPARLGYGKIPLSASIVAIADTYDAVTSKRVYSEKRSPYIAADIILRESLAGRTDQRISKVFYDRLLSLSIGNRVRLSNHELGEIVYINPLKPYAPTVKVGDVLYHLEEDQSIFIEDVL